MILKVTLLLAGHKMGMGMTSRVTRQTQLRNTCDSKSHSYAILVSI